MLLERIGKKIEIFARLRSKETVVNAGRPRIRSMRGVHPSNRQHALHGFPLSYLLFVDVPINEIPFSLRWGPNSTGDASEKTVHATERQITHRNTHANLRHVRWSKARYVRTVIVDRGGAAAGHG